MSGLRRTTTQWMVLAFGVWFTVGNYVAGTLIWPSTITDPNAMHMMHLFGFIPVMINGWHLYFHLLNGLICLWFFRSHGGAVVAGFATGAFSVLAGVLGLLVPGQVFGLIMVDTFGNWVHIIEGAGLLAAGLVGLRRANRS